MAKANIKIEFVESPTGLFKLAHHVGDVVTFPKQQAEELIASGVAIEYKPSAKKEAAE